MDLTNLNASLSAVSSYDIEAGSLAETVGVALLDMNMELMDTMNQQMIKMMEQSVMPHLGRNIDISV